VHRRVITSPTQLHPHTPFSTMSSPSTAISGNNNANEIEWQSSWPPHAVEMARLALQLASQEWSLTGADSDCCETTATSTSTTDYDGKDEEITKRMVALLFIRMVALVTCNLGNVYPTSFNNINNGSFNISFNSSSRPIGRAKKKIYEDYSTSTICKTVLRQSDQYQHRSSEVNGGNNNCIPFPTSLSPLIIPPTSTLYVKTIILRRRFRIIMLSMDIMSF
jgi:hypothetical protein